MKLTRRSFIKTNAIAATAAAAGITIPGINNAIAKTSSKQIRWDKAACRFCGTGCSVLVGTKDGRVIATQGDPDAPVNRGLNCIKGYFLSKIMYGKDRLTKPLLRMTDGQYDKDPLIYEDAVRFDHLTYMDAINKRLQVMDSIALSLCMDNDLPILVLNLWDSDALRSALFGEKVGTLVSD